MKRILSAASGPAIGSTLLASPNFVEVHESADRDEWFAAVGDYGTIAFMSYPNGTQVADQ